MPRANAAGWDWRKGLALLEDRWRLPNGMIGWLVLAMLELSFLCQYKQ
jgi:hypothetical protein